MFQAFKIICALVCIGGSQILQAGTDWPVLLIKKQADVKLNYKQMPPVSLNKEYAKKLPPYYWPQKVLEFFPDSKKQYQIRLNLDGFQQSDLISISAFLQEISKDSDLQQRVPLLVLENGTNFKFNKLFSGIESFFTSVSNAEVYYAHSGKQTPASPSKKLHSLSPENFIAILKERLESPVMENKEGVIKVGNFLSISIPVSRSPEILKDLIQETYYQERAQLLQEKWKALTWEGEDPKCDLFLGLSNADQFKEIHYDSLSQFKPKENEKIVFLEVGGMGYQGPEDLIKACQNLPFLRALRICDSHVKVEDFSALCRSQMTFHKGNENELSENDEEGEDLQVGNEDLSTPLLSKENIFFVDISNARIEGGITELKKHFEEKNLLSFFSYFLWIENGLEAGQWLEPLKLEHQERHRLYWVFCNYLNLLKEKSRLHT